MSNFSDKLHSAPFIRLLVPLIAGIILGDHCPPELKWVFFCVSLCFTVLLLFLITVSFRRESLFGLILFPILLSLGLFIANDCKYFPKPLPEGEYFGVVTEYPVEKEKSFRALIRLTEPKIKILAYFEKADSLVKVEPGTVLWFRGNPELLQKSGNPFEFDYQVYSIRNKIGHRIYLKNGKFQFLHAKKIPNLAEWSLIIRNRLLGIIENSGLKGEVFHLVSAISLGAREELEPETTQSFSKTGVIHVLAVSGMNVGIIYVVLDLILRFLKRKKSGIILHTFIILLAVWGYALITGLSASVLRAAAMFSFIVIGKNLSRNPNIYNTLSASAFVLLCVNPSLIYDVGFQLSYAAVFSIVFFHPYIYGVCYFKYWIPDQIWSLITVSFAAQIGTLPFLLHYFHQFPTWFLLANLMVIPLVTIILYLSFIVFAVAPVIPFLGWLLTRALELAGQGMLFSVRFIERLPHSVLVDLYPSDYTMFVAVVFAILVSLFIICKSRIAFIGALISIIILLIFNDLSIYTKFLQKEVVVFNIPGKILVALTAGRKTIWLTTDKNITEEKLKYFTKPYEGFRGIKESSIISLSDSCYHIPYKIYKKGHFINFEGLVLCILNDLKQNNATWENFPNTDIIILSDKYLPDPDLVLKNHPSAVIIDCRTSIKVRKLNNNQLKAILEPNILNTNLGGAVQIRFKSAVSGEKIILSYGYFIR